MSREILLASNNGHKLREFRGLLEPLGFAVVSPAAIGVTLEVEETGSTFAENAVLKADALRDRTAMVVLADDSGLVVDALGGEPGIRSARYGAPGLTDAGRTALVLTRLSAIPPPDRTARFVAAIAVSIPGRATQVFEGIAEGIITPEPVGEGGFGYDPIFYFPPAGCTFAQMSESAKGAVSHRGKAARLAVEYLRAVPDLFYTERASQPPGGQ